MFLSAKNVTSVGFSFDEKQFVTKERDELLRKGKLTRNDVVLTTRGTVGNVALYRSDIPYENVRINSGMVILRSDPNEILSEYLYYAMKSSDIQGQIRKIHTGSAQPQLPVSHMVNLELSLPSIDEQRIIVSILSALDDKIAVNNKLNDYLAAA